MSGILSYPTLTGEAFSLTSALQWLDYLMAALDVYTWVFEKKLLAPSEVFQCTRID